MKQFISIPANSQHIDKVLEKAKSLKITAKPELSWDSGFKYDDKSKREILVFAFNQALYDYILELEPTVEQKKAKKSGNLIVPTAEEVVKLGY